MFIVPIPASTSTVTHGEASPVGRERPWHFYWAGIICMGILAIPWTRYAVEYYCTGIISARGEGAIGIHERK